MYYHQSFDDESSLTLTALVEQGRSLFQKAAALARKMVRDQGELPIVDAFKIDGDGRLVETFSFPLLPLVSDEDSKQFFIYISLLTQWYREMAAFLGKAGLQ